MIATTTDNIFSSLPNGEHKVIVHGCNCLGVMGSGIAKTIKDLYPEAYAVYKEQEKKQGLNLGGFSWVTIPEKRITIVNLLTQAITGGVRPVSYDAIVSGFENIRNECGKQYDNLHSNSAEHGRHDPSAWLSEGQTKFNISFPAIGCGLGGGDWSIVEVIINKTLPSIGFNKTLHVLPS